MERPETPTEDDFLDVNEDSPCPENFQCKICQAKSTGIHYGVQSCEGCKAFFKRGLMKQSHYKCYFGRACIITPKTRGRCKFCRLQKCIAEGMSLEGGKVSRSSKVVKEKESSLKRSAAEIYSDLEIKQEEESFTDQDSPSSGNTSRTSSVSLSGRFADISVSSPQSAVSSHVSVIRSTKPSVRDLVPFARSPSEVSSLVSVFSRNNKSKGSETLRSFLEEALTDTADLSNGLAVEIARKRVKLPEGLTSTSYMDRYWNVMKERNNCLEKTIKAVSDAVKVVFWDQIDACQSHRST